MITLISLGESDHKILTSKSKDNITIIQEACKILDINCICSNKIFVDKTSYIDSSPIDELKKNIEKNFSSNYTFFYINLNRNHPRYDYYSIFGFSSIKEDDMKKILKIHKLKAFL